MKPSTRLLSYLLAAALFAGTNPPELFAKGYSSGGRSYSSHSSSHSSSSHSSSSSSRSSSSSSRSSSSGGSSSRSSSGSGSSGSSSRSSSGGSSSSSSRSSSPSSPSSSSKTYKSSGGKSYSSGSTGSETDRKGYSSGKSYTAGSGKLLSSPPSRPPAPSDSSSAKRSSGQDSGSSLTFDQAAARARKEETSKQDYTRFKESQGPASPAATPPVAAPSTYQGSPPPLSTGAQRSYRRYVYVPDDYTIYTRPRRVSTWFSPYYSRPVVIYNDPYNSFFWWWLLDRSLDDRAWWAYHHRYDMDPARYEALVANDQQLESRVNQLEQQEVARDPTFVPAGLDRDLMYTDQYVSRAYSNRPTRAGVIGFWLFAVPTAIGLSWFFIWLIWFKRWKTA